MNQASPSAEPSPNAGSGPTFTGYPWKRLLLSALFLAILSLSFWAVLFIVIAQFALRVFDADASADLASLGRRLGAYMAEMAAYASFARDAAPFPFSSFPKG